MTAVVPDRSAVPPRTAGFAVVLVGIGALLARPLLDRIADDPRLLLVALFLVLGLTGLRWPVPEAEGNAAVARPGAELRPSVVLLVGIVAVAVGRLLGAGGTRWLAPALASLLLNTLAAVAEEAFFRRLVYGLLSSWGPGVAVGGSALCFAAVHVTVWGWAVLPLDLAAGLLLGWQRAATGGWRVPAVTHVVANALALV